MIHELAEYFHTYESISLNRGSVVKIQITNLNRQQNMKKLQTYNRDKNYFNILLPFHQILPKHLNRFLFFSIFIEKNVSIAISD